MLVCSRICAPNIGFHSHNTQTPTVVSCSPSHSSSQISQPTLNTPNLGAPTKAGKRKHVFWVTFTSRKWWCRHAKAVYLNSNIMIKRFSDSSLASAAEATKTNKRKKKKQQQQEKSEKTTRVTLRRAIQLTHHRKLSIACSHFLLYWSATSSSRNKLIHSLIHTNSVLHKQHTRKEYLQEEDSQAGRQSVSERNCTG